MKFENTQVFNFEGALRGMRNPMNSWDKSDSDFSDECYNPLFEKGCAECEYFLGFNASCKPRIGDNDMRLAQKLIRGGSEHRKFMRQIFVSVDITAPLYWWKEFDTYKVATVANSCSTMHKIHEKEFTRDDFSCEYLIDFDKDAKEDECCPLSPMNALDFTIDMLNEYRRNYLHFEDDDYNPPFSKKVLWYQMIQLLPSSYNQRRTVTMSYENLLAMCSKGQRRFHKLNEWSGVDNPELPNFISWARTLPYAQELIFIDEVDC